MSRLIAPETPSNIIFEGHIADSCAGSSRGVAIQKKGGGGGGGSVFCCFFLFCKNICDKIMESMGVATVGMTNSHFSICCFPYVLEKVFVSPSGSRLSPKGCHLGRRKSLQGKLPSKHPPMNPF